MRENDDFKNDVCTQFVERTMTNLKGCTDLLNRCKTFDVKKVIDRTIRKAIDAEIKGDGVEPTLIWAPTQSGKSAYKALELDCYLSLGIIVILCTKGKTEAKGLASKLRLYFKGSIFEERIFDVYDEHLSMQPLHGTVSKLADERVGLGGTLVIPDTKERITYASEVLRWTKIRFRKLEWRFIVALILDECDAISRRRMNRR